MKIIQITLISLFAISISFNTLAQTETLESDTINTQQDDEVFTIVEDLPEYIGGNQKMHEFIGNNLNYPADAKQNFIQGIVYISFVVEKDGTVSNVKVARGIGHGCDEEAIRVVSSMPAWKPGKQKGKPVRVKFNLPIRYKLNLPATETKTEPLSKKELKEEQKKQKEMDKQKKKDDKAKN
jgi:TonB family protein